MCTCIQVNALYMYIIYGTTNLAVVVVVVVVVVLPFRKNSLPLSVLANTAMTSAMVISVSSLTNGDCSQATL